MAILMDRNTRIVIQGITGREASMVTKHMLDYGTPVLAGVTPGKRGVDVHGVPVYDTVKQAVQQQGVTASLIVVPPAFVLDAVAEAVDSGIQLIVVTSENIPQMDVLRMLHIAELSGVPLIGPNTVGMINPQERIKLGSIGGDRPERCFVPGRVGVISRSGGMTAETSWMVKRAGLGVSSSVGIGGDSYIGMNIVDLLKLFEKDEDTDAVVTFSEPGTSFEEDAAQLIHDGGFTKPLVSYVAGRFTEKMPENTVFGHAGAMISGDYGRPSIKMRKLSEAGAYVVERFDEMIHVLQEVIGHEAR